MNQCRYPVLAQALYDNEQIDAKVKAKTEATNYVLIHLRPRESYHEAKRRIIADPATPEAYRNTLKEAENV